MSPVSRTESITYIVICQIGKFLGEAFACLLRLGLFLTPETCILKKNNISVLHIGNCLGSISAGNIVIRYENNVLTELLG